MTRLTPRVVLVLAAAGLVAAACTQGPPEAADPGTTEATEASPATGTTEAESMCRRVLTELDRRDEAGTIDWEAIEAPDEEPTEQELESVTIDREVFPADVVAEGERPAFPDFPDRLDVALLRDVELVEAVDTCYEIGLLADEQDEEDGEAGDDEAG
jgi:hypothetical protein